MFHYQLSSLLSIEDCDREDKFVIEDRHGRIGQDNFSVKVFAVKENNNNNISIFCKFYSATVLKMDERNGKEFSQLGVKSWLIKQLLSLGLFKS